MKMINCVVCGTAFEANGNAKVCGDVCRKIRKTELLKGRKAAEKEKAEAGLVVVEDPTVAEDTTFTDVQLEETAPEVEVQEPVEEVKEEVVAEEPKVEPKAKKESGNRYGLTDDSKWVLTVKDKATKSFKNIVFFTNDVKVAHKFIDEMRKEKLMTFVSLTDTERINKYITTGEVTKLFAGNLKAIAEKKVPADPKVMFKDLMDVVNATEGVDAITVDVVVPEPAEVATA